MVINIIYVKIAVIAIAILLAICLGVVTVGQNSKKAFKFDEIEAGSPKESEQKIRLFGVEQILLSYFKLNNPPNSVIIAERAIILVLACVFAFMFHYIAIFFVFEIFMFLFSKNKEKTVEDENGLTYIPKTNEFLDMYIPAINNGESVNQIMDRFVQMQGDPELTKWWFDENKENIDPPRQWNDVIKIYQNGEYNEKNGFEDSAEVYQQDILRQLQYYNNFKQKIGDINPIKGVYYIAMPIITLMSYSNDPEFWSEPVGLITSLGLCALMGIFTILLGNLHKDTCEKLF